MRSRPPSCRCSRPSGSTVSRRRSGQSSSPRGRTGSSSSQREAPGRIVPLAVDRPREGFAGVSIGADRLNELDALAPTLDGLRGGGLLFVHPVAGDPPAAAPAWWPAVVDYTSQMQRAYFAWLAGAQERWPDVTVVFAILAGGAPIQLERLSSRGVDVRSSLHRNVFFDTASYGRRALELCIETFGVEQLVFGTDVPVVDPTPAIRAVDAFGESVARLVRQDNLLGLLPVTGIETWLAGRLEADRDLTRPELLELSAAIGPSARCGRRTSVTTWSTGTTCRCTATRTSTSG